MFDNVARSTLRALGICVGVLRDVTVLEANAPPSTLSMTSRISAGRQIPAFRTRSIGRDVSSAVVGSADGVWRTHVDQVRARLDISYGGDEVTDEAAAAVARAASDIDAARIQITGSVDPATSTWAFAQSIARARGAADRLLTSSRHALDASDPVTNRWRDVHAGARLAGRIIGSMRQITSSRT